MKEKILEALIQWFMAQDEYQDCEAPIDIVLDGWYDIEELAEFICDSLEEKYERQ